MPRRIIFQEKVCVCVAFDESLKSVRNMLKFFGSRTPPKKVREDDDPSETFEEIMEAMTYSTRRKSRRAVRLYDFLLNIRTSFRHSSIVLLKVQFFFDVGICL